MRNGLDLKNCTSTHMLGKTINDTLPFYPTEMPEAAAMVTG